MTAVCSTPTPSPSATCCALVRQPWFIAVTLVQPVIWLLLYGALFERMIEIPGFVGGDYQQYLAPGVLVMTAFFSSGWSGMSMIEDLDRGVTDRLLVTPVRRMPLIAGRVLQNLAGLTIQSLLIVALAAGDRRLVRRRRRRRGGARARGGPARHRLQRALQRARARDAQGARA